MKVTSTVCLPGAKSSIGTLALPSAPTGTSTGAAPSMDTNAVPLNGAVPSLASIAIPLSSVPTVTAAVSLGSTSIIESAVATSWTPSLNETAIGLSATVNLSAGIVTTPSSTGYSLVSPLTVTFTLSTATGLPFTSVTFTAMVASSP